MDTLYLVSCVSVKLDHPAQAKDLYCSPWFKAARRYVERLDGRWRILSAKYGVLHPDTIIDPYEMTLKTMRSHDRAVWGLKVREQMPEADRYVLLAGKMYAEHLIKALRPDLPLRGLGIGQQLSWFRSHTGIEHKRSTIGAPCS